MLSNRTLLVAALAAVTMAGCNRDAPDATAAEPAPVETAPLETASVEAAPDATMPASPVDAVSAEPANDGTSAPQAAPFDVATVPLSGSTLGEWPYVAAPDGYEFNRARTLDLSQVPFWTGQSLQPVEGKVFEASIRAVGEKSHSRFEVLKRFDQALTALGAHKVTTSEVPRDVLRDQLPKDFGVEFNAGAGGYYGGEEVSIYVLRQADRVVWYKIHSDGNAGSVLIAESEDVPASS